MLSMSKLRDNSKGMLWTLLFFFIASMAVGGLVGGANIISTIQSFFGKIDTRLYVGKVGDTPIPISYYLSERQIQLNRFRQQGRTIDSRAIQSAGDFAWNNIVDRAIKDEKIRDFNLEVQDDEIYNFLLLSPPPAFQDNLKTLGLFSDEEGNFDLDSYQNSIRNGLLPDTTQNLLLVWENYLKTYLADRKLQNIYNNTISVSDLEVKRDFMHSNINCSIDILNIKSNSIPDSLIAVSKEEIEDEYNENKEEKYSIDESITLQYVLWENIDPTGIDSLDIIDMQDSLLQLSIDFSAEAQITSFQEAIETYEITKIDTVNVTESFSNNSGLPYQMGAIRQAVRFAFDNSINETSDYFQTDNGLAVFNIVKKNNASYTSFDEVSNSIERSIKRSKKNEYAFDLLSKTDINQDWKKLAADNEFLELIENTSSTIGGSFNTIGKNNTLIGLLPNMEVGSASSVIKSSSNVFVFKLNSKDDFNESLYEEIKDSLKLNLIASGKNQLFNQWLKNKKEEIEIQDLRSKIF